MTDPTLRAPDGMALCAKCGEQFVFWLPQRTDGFDDVFHKIQQSMGLVVCPDCIKAAGPMDVPTPQPQQL